MHRETPDDTRPSGTRVAGDDDDASCSLPDSGSPNFGLPNSGLPDLGLRREATTSTAQREPGCTCIPPNAPAPTLPIHDICTAYAEGASVTSVARAYGLSDPEVRRILVLNGVTIRPRGGGHDNAHVLDDLRVARALRPKHASAPQFSATWFRQCDRAYVAAVLAAHPEKGHVR